MDTTPDQKTTQNILKVNHAGEYGAIRIYQVQILVAKIFHPDLLPFLNNTITHENDHCRKFSEAMTSHGTRPCYTLWFWSWGGYVLGLISAITGRNGIMVCTEAVEEAVHHHLNDQLNFLRSRDAGLTKLIEKIMVEELEHLAFAQSHVKHNKITKLAHALIFRATEILIWLSTQGALSRMERGLKA